MLTLRQAGWARRFVLVAITTVAFIGFAAVPAGAVFRGPAPSPHARNSTGTQLTLTSTSYGQSVNGWIANSDSTFDPTTGYPSSVPPDFSVKNEGFAGVIIGTPVGGGAPLTLYCIDINTDTYIGYGYVLGTWDAANVPNVGFVARILDEYYPTTSAPALANLNETAAAVQAAIWFFSDRFMLDPSDPLYSAVKTIVDAVIAQGAVPAPNPPSLTVTPSDLSGPTGSVLGPYTVRSTATTTVSATGATMYSDAAATHTIANGSQVPDGQEIWLKSTGGSTAVLQATAVADVPSGNVYLYEGGASLAQKLILSQPATLNTTVSATAEFLAPGSLQVTKTIAGPAAGQQGAVTIHTVCNGTALTPDFSIAANAPAGSQSHTYTNIPAGSVCTVTETVDGSSSTVGVTVTGSGQQVTVPSGSTVTAPITDTYNFLTGSLTVNKEIGGPAAGQQGAVTIHVVCNGTALTPDWTLTAGTAAGNYSHTWSGIAGGSSCIINETANGATDSVSVITDGSDQTITVGSGQNPQASISDTYNFIVGSLTVTKTIAGPAAGHQGQVVIKVTCDGTELSPELVVNADQPAGDYSHTYTGIAEGSSCSAEEISDGSSSSVTVVTTGDVGTPVTIPAGGTATLHITDTYDFPTGSLIVTKNSIGPAAGQQGQVTISVSCDGTQLPDFIVPAGTTGITANIYNDIRAGATCTVDETVDGSTSAVSVTTVGGNQTVTIQSGQAVYANVTNTYDFVPGSLTVTKTITGPGAGQQGAVTITVTCQSGNTETTLSPPFVIPASSTGDHSYTYDDIPAGSECTVTETGDGSNGRVAAVRSGSGIVVTIPAGGTATAHLTDTYETGLLVINKTITGPAAGLQDRVVIHTVCNGTALTPDFTIDGGAPANSYQHTYSGILAGSTCTVTETSNGATSTVTVVTQGSGQTVTISANGTGSATLTDTYTQVPGSLVVTKDIAGPAAGRQGEVRIEVSCNDVPLTPEFVIPAGTGAGSQSHTYSDIPAGSHCKVTETADGSTRDVNVTVTGDGQTVTVPAAGSATAALTDTYTYAFGSLVVNKTITGPGAGQQGEIVIHVSCNGDDLPDFVIPAGTPAGTVSHTYHHIPSGAVCTVTETSDGSTGSVAVATRGSGVDVTIPAGGTATADLTDTYETGSLIVNKTITGPAASQQGDVVIAVGCDETGTAATLPDFVIPAGTAAGTVSMSYPNILAGSTCSLTETATGATSTVTVETEGSPQQVTISANGSATANVTNTYDFVPGALVVTKDIAGPAAGQQGEITIAVSCALNGAETSYDPFVIPAGTAAGSYQHEYPDIAAGSVCTVEETANGSTSAVSVTTLGGDQTVTVDPGTVGTANITDTYSFVPGSLIVSKAITGPAAGSQGQVTIAVSCVEADVATPLPDFVVPAGATGTQSETYSDIPAGSKCTVTETADGSTSTISVTITGSGQEVTVPAGGTASANLTDTYSAVPGSLVVNKTITGPAAGLQSQVTISVSCVGVTTPLPNFVIAAGAPAGTRSETYTNIPAGSACTVTETQNGASNTVSVVTVGSPQTVTVPANGGATANVTDTYSQIPSPLGSLVVTKNIIGPAAGQQGPVTVTASCNGQALSPVLQIAAGATGVQSQTYEGIPAGSTCTATEAPDGSTANVAVTVTGDGQTVTIPPGGNQALALTDTYSFRTGGLVVNKTIAGPAAGQQGMVTVHTICAGTALTPDLSIPAGTAAGTVSQSYDNIPAGSTCTVTETGNGSTSAVSVITSGSGQQVTVPADKVAEANLTDVYGFGTGSLTITKTIAGPAAGQQGAVTVEAVCNGVTLSPELAVPAGAPAGTSSQDYHGIPGGSTCAVSETADGSNSAVQVKVTGDGQHLTVLGGATATAALTDTYTLAPGSLVVSKTITGGAAGQQGPVTISVTCNGTTLTPAFVVPGMTAASTVSRTYSGIAGGATCDVTETTDGATSAVTVTTAGASQHVTVPAGKVVQVTITDTYAFAPGTLTVTKTIAGPAAGLQAPISILADCGGPDNQFALHIPGGAPAGPVPGVFYDIPAGSTCTVTEIEDGHSETIGVVGVGSGQKVTIGAGESAAAHLTDTFTAVAVPTTTTTVPVTPPTTSPLVTTTTTPHVTTTTIPHVTTTTSAHVTTTTSPSSVTTTTSAHVTTSTTSAVVTPTTSATTATTSVTTTTSSQVTSTTAPLQTTTTSSSSVTLPETGVGAATPRLVELALAVMAAGGVLVAIAGRRRHPRTNGRRDKK